MNQRHEQREQEEHARRQHEISLEQLRQGRADLMTTDRRDQAVRIVQDAARRKFAKSGQTLSAENMRHIEKMANERFDRDPRTIDQVLQMEARRRKELEKVGKGELREAATEVRHERRRVREDGGRRLPQQQEQDHQRAGRELERTR